MYRFLGNSVVRVWPAILLVWILALVALKVVAPNWQDVIEQGEFAFLPDEMPSLTGERQYEKAWGEPFASNIVLVVRRERTELNQQDRDFIVNVLKPRLVEIVKRVGLPKPSGQGATAQEPDSTVVAGSEVEEPEEIDKKIKTFDTTGWQKILDSSNGKATMVVINLETEFFNATNIPLIDAIADLIDRDGSDAGVREDRNQLAIEIGPAGFPVQAEEGDLGVLRTFVDIMQPHAFIAGEVFDVFGRIGPARKV